MNSPIIRAANHDDIAQMMEMFNYSRGLMRAGGNSEQWVNGYPSQSLIADDIRNGHSFLVTDNGKAVGTFAFIIGRDPTYEHIEGGSWLDDAHPYGTIHRMARAKGCHGIFSAAIEWCRRQASSLRIDTHTANHPMIHLIGKHNFSYRGIIYIADGTPRLAFQMLPTGLLCEPLMHYIGSCILPRYDAFDEAHRRDHAETVIRNSLSLARHYDVNINMVYTIAACHDLGLAHSRERHHLVSGDIIRNDGNLLNWFSPTQIITMAEAAEDHRASSASAPRSIYGKIVAEADRDIEPLKIIKRTILYGLSHFPDLDRENQWDRTLSHLQTKYGDGGYLKLWLPESDNAAKLAKLRDIIHDRQQLRQLFDLFYDGK